MHIRQSIFADDSNSHFFTRIADIGKVSRPFHIMRLAEPEATHYRSSPSLYSIRGIS